MAATYGPGDDFRGARFTAADLTGATFRDCDLRGAKVADSLLMDVDVSGLVQNFRVNGIDVTAYVDEQLDREHPERAQLREVRTVADHQAMWATVERIWAAAGARAERLPEPLRHERVADEWSFVETLRHLVFATDAWAFRTILDEPMPFHPLGLCHSGYRRADAEMLGLDLSARPSYPDVVEVRTGRLARVRQIVQGLTDAELERTVHRSPGPGYPEEERTVRRCLRVVFDEECEHHRYATRDLAVLEARATAGGS